MKKNYLTHNWEIKEHTFDKRNYRCKVCGIFFTSIFPPESLKHMKIESCQMILNQKIITDIIE